MTSVNKLALGIATMIKRKNVMYFSATVWEEHIEIRYAKGNTNIPLLLKTDIEDKISKIKSSNRPKIGYDHIGGIQFMIKAHFREGIDSPIILAVLDNRIQDRKHAVPRIIQGNLSYKKLIFKIYPKYSISLRDRNINKTLTLCHDFKYFDIMHEGSYPYSITYAIKYALTNSANSEMFANKYFIEIDKLFSKVGNIKYPEILREIDLSKGWKMNLSSQPTLIKGNTTKSIEYTPEGRIIIRHKRSFSIPKREPKFRGTQSFTRCSHLVTPPSHEILATIRKNNQNLKIKIDYNNGKSWHETFAILDTWAAKSYVDAKMIKYLERKILIEPHTYVGFNRERKTLRKYCKIPLKIKGTKFIFPFFIEPYYETEINPLLLGMNFLHNFSPYCIGDREMSITIEGIKQTILRYV